jgi:hypothetical protein
MTSRALKRLFVNSAGQCCLTSGLVSIHFLYPSHVYTYFDMSVRSERKLFLELLLISVLYFTPKCWESHGSRTS